MEVHILILVIKSLFTVDTNKILSFFPVDMESCIYLVQCGLKKPQLKILFLQKKKIIIY